MANQNDLTLLPCHDRNDKQKMESIFNPYDQVSNGSNLKPISEKEATIPNLLIQSDGCFGNNWGKDTTDSYTSIKSQQTWQHCRSRFPPTTMPREAA